MTSTRISKKLALVVASVAVAAGATPAYAVPDYGSPDARDAAISSQTTSPSQSDFRSPDARDAANGYAPPAPVATPTDSSPSSGGVDWLTAALGVAGVGGVVLLLLGLMTHRRHTPGPHPA